MAGTVPIATEKGDVFSYVLSTILIATEKGEGDIMISNASSSKILATGYWQSVDSGDDEFRFYYGLSTMDYRLNKATEKESN